MSFQAAGWAINQQFVKDPTARHVLLVLASYASKEGKAAFPSVESLMEDTGLSRRTVQYKLQHLIELGAITEGDQSVVAAHIHRKDKRTISYDLNMAHPESERGATGAPRDLEGANTARGATDAPREPVTGCISQHDGVQMTTSRGANDDVTGCTTCTRSGSKHSKEQSINKSARQAARIGFVETLPECISSEVWQTWVEHRLALATLKKIPWTAPAARISVAKLAALHQQGLSVKEIVEEAVLRGWTGLFPPRPVTGAAGPAASSDARWWTTTAGIVQRAKQLGQKEQGEGEHWQRFKARVFKGAGPGEWMDEMLAATAKESTERYEALLAYFSSVKLASGGGN